MNKTFAFSLVASFALLPQIQAHSGCGCDAGSGSVGAPLEDGVAEGWSSALLLSRARYDDMHSGGEIRPNSRDRFTHRYESTLSLRYNFDCEWALGLKLPFVFSDYQRYSFPEGRAYREQSSGLGDVEFRAFWTPIRIDDGDFQLSAGLSSGLKLPTGRYSLPDARFHEHGVHGSPDQDHHMPMDLYEPGAGREALLGGGWSRVSWMRILLDLGLDSGCSWDNNLEDPGQTLTLFAAPGLILWQKEAQALEFAGTWRQVQDFGALDTWQQSAGFRLRAHFDSSLSAELSWEEVYHFGGEASSLISLDDRIGAALVWRF
ncbi:MAG: hypothetical protein RL095_2738 [Verrucomicrobiota bacterium]